MITILNASYRKDGIGHQVVKVLTERCRINDDTPAIIAELDITQKVIVVSPINFFDLTAVFRVFLERLACFGYWPNNRYAPTFRRKPDKSRSALLIATSAMPGFVAPFVTNAKASFKTFAKTLGLRPAGVYFLGLKSRPQDQLITEKEKRKIERMID